MYANNWVEVMVVVSPDVVPSRGCWLYLLDERRCLHGEALSGKGNVLACLESTLKLPPLAKAESLYAALPLEGHSLTAPPFISGERNPGRYDEASMAVVGINAHTLPADLLRACFEALGIIPDVAHVPVELGAPLLAGWGATLSTNKVQNASENSTGHF